MRIRYGMAEPTITIKILLYRIYLKHKDTGKIKPAVYIITDTEYDPAAIYLTLRNTPFSMFIDFNKLNSGIYLPIEVEPYLLGTERIPPDLIIRPYNIDDYDIDFSIRLVDLDKEELNYIDDHGFYGTRVNDNDKDGYLLENGRIYRFINFRIREDVTITFQDLLYTEWKNEKRYITVLVL